MSATFSSSEGWNWTGPAPSQRVAPFTVMPTCGTITARVRANETPTRSGVSRRITRRPPREMACITISPIAPKST